jgi:HEAT repeat protein
MDYQELVKQLNFPATRCQAAEALVNLGDRLALLDLVDAYEMSYEGDLLCLLDTMQALGGAAAADALFDQAVPEQVRRILHLMEFFPDDAHLPRLAQALGSSDQRVRKQARLSLSTQRQTPAWLALLTGLLDAVDPVDRRRAVDSLARRPEASVQTALHQRLAVETDAGVRALLLAVNSGGQS